MSTAIVVPSLVSDRIRSILQFEALIEPLLPTIIEAPCRKLPEIGGNWKFVESLASGTGIGLSVHESGILSSASGGWDEGGE
jgi:hypothetical protein